MILKGIIFVNLQGRTGRPFPPFVHKDDNHLLLYSEFVIHNSHHPLKFAVFSKLFIPLDDAYPF